MTGPVEAVGFLLVDSAALVRQPGIARWRLALAHADRVFRATAPLAWILCWAVGMMESMGQSVYITRVGAPQAMTSIATGTLGIRELAVLIGIITIAGSAGAENVAELGAMRIDDEIDAIEVMGVAPFPLLVSTRIFGTILASIPLFAGCIALLLLGAYVTAVSAVGVSSQAFLAYLYLGLAPVDIVIAGLKGVAASAVIVTVATGVGYRTRGGPAEVGIAVGNGLTNGLMFAVLVNVGISFLFWGVESPVR